MADLRLELTDDLIRELTRRIAPAGVSGQYAIEYDREQKPRKLRSGNIYAPSQFSHFDPPEALEVATKR
jgi:hypothetical protein